MKFRILVLTLCLWGTHAMATTSADVNQDNCPSGCNQPPAAPASFSYDDAGKYFDRGLAPTSDQLLGNWIEVGTVKLAGFPDDSDPDSYNPAGIKNKDGSSALTLSFSQVKAFDDSLQDTVLLLNLGRKGGNQGPNEVEINDNGACFAQWSYLPEAQGGGINQSGHYDYECRLMRGNPRKMVCANSYHFENPSATRADYLRYNGRIVYYVGYIKQ